MPQFTSGPVSIYFEEHGEGFPLLLLAPGGLDSTIDAWLRAAINPLEAYAGEFHVIAMDQRNAGRSTGPFEVADPWGSYVGDQLALMDHLGIDRFLVMGCCIGCSYALKLIERAPMRIAAAVLEQPIGLTPETHAGWVERRTAWAAKLLTTRVDLDASAAEPFGVAMWERDFVGAVPRGFVASISTPLLVLPGTDAVHPRETALEIAELASSAVLVDPWKDRPSDIERGTAEVRTFLHRHAD